MSAPAPGDEHGPPRRRAGILGRITGLRGDPPPAAAPAEPPAAAVPAEGEDPERTELRRLEQRVDHLEAAFEGLQDSVHREAQRHARELADLQTRTHPSELARTLSEDARRRGL